MSSHTNLVTCLGLTHGREGIMMSQWSDRQLALLARRRMGFTGAEVKKMQEEIGVRRILQDDGSDLLALGAHKHPLQ